MGMYDEINLEVPLPIDLGNDKCFQTKSLDCLMDQYKITPEGELFKEEHDFEEVPANERDYPDPKDPLHFLGSRKSINSRWVPVDFHGVIDFYDGVENPETYIYRWVEYRAFFNHGSLEKIEVVEDRTEDRTAYRKEIKERLDKQKERAGHWYFRFWDRVKHWKFRAVNSLINFLSRIR